MRKRQLKKLVSAVIVGAMCVTCIPVMAAETTETGQADESGDREISVTDYGANGSDQEDDRNAFNEALRVALETEGVLTVDVPAGTYYLSGTIGMYSDTTLKVDPDAVIVSTNKESQPLISTFSLDGTNPGGYNRASNIVVDGGTWDRDGTVGTASNGFYFFHCQDITIENLTIKNIYQDHHIEFSGVQNSTIKNCTFMNYLGGDNLSTYAGEAVQLDYTDEGTSSTSEPYDDTPCKNITVDGCTFIDCNGGVGSHHYDSNTPQTTNITITNNTFTNMLGACVQLRYTDDAVISGNTATDVDMFCYLNNNTTNIDISNNSVTCKNQNTANTFGDGHDYAILVYESSATITGNTINNAYDIAIGTWDASPLTISGNTITNTATNAIDLNGSGTNATVTGNTITNAGTYGIYAQGYAKGTVSENTYSNNGTDYKNSGTADIDRYDDPAPTPSPSPNPDPGTYYDGVVKVNGVWCYYVDNVFQSNYTGVANKGNSNGWWYIDHGYVDFNANTVAQNKNGWWYVLGGKVQFGFTGLADYKNANGWWYIVDGKVDFTHNGVDKNKNGWYYVTSGKVNFDYTGVANYKNSNGWWYIKNGAVDFTANTVAKNNNGWFCVRSGKVDFGFTGIASNSNGSWYIKGGQVQFGYSGRVTYNGRRYTIRNGKVA